ncbi:MAG: hypothetical protein PVI86_10580 [Phycisphaerae bacterium]|jgi:hypothetical protein
MFVRKLFVAGTFAVGAFSVVPLVQADSANVGQPGSLLIFPNVEIKWDAEGNVIRDTIITLANGYVKGVYVQMYFVNGDPPLDAVYDGNPPRLIERAHPGWNYSDCMIRLGRYESTYWSAANGQPGGCPFNVLDPGGRPDSEKGTRMLRGFIYAWAVDQFGREIRWNYLTGGGLIVDYRQGTGWEYSAQAFQALLGETTEPLPEPGTLRLDGNEYTLPYSVLVLNFSTSGLWTLPGDGLNAYVDTYVTLMPASQDLRQDGDGPVITKAKFYITNAHGVEFSGTERCITCWDRTPLSAYDPPNHFLRDNIHTDTGLARIDGIPSSVVCGSESQAAALVGVAARVLTFNGLDDGGDWNRNGVIDLEDHDALVACLNASGPDPSPAPEDCRAVFALDDDDDVDLQDYNKFAAGFGLTFQSFSPAVISGQGTEPAIIRYDVTTGGP